MVQYLSANIKIKAYVLNKDMNIRYRFRRRILDSIKYSWGTEQGKMGTFSYRP